MNGTKLKFVIAFDYVGKDGVSSKLVVKKGKDTHGTVILNSPVFTPPDKSYYSLSGYSQAEQWMYEKFVEVMRNLFGYKEEDDDLMVKKKK